MGFEVRDIRFSYGTNIVLRDLSINMDPGRFYGIVGPNGCGKTTLLDILVKSKEPETGTVKYNGRDLGKYTKKELARAVALVPQDFYIHFAFTLEEIILMGRHPYVPRFSSPLPQDIEIVNAVMAETGIKKFAHRHVTDLSGGEKQRVVFARALAQDTPVLILDEATSNLDIKYTLDLLNIAKTRVRTEGKTVIAVMQNLNLAALYCDYLIFLKEGKIAAYGDIDTVFTEKNIRAVFGIESKVCFDPYSNSKRVVFRGGIL
ncbi:MAG: ABC transporter ATP-binding protein [Desulfobacterales bacterium]|nr:ABC transporter ATP-binding protein [Desulfobacterales bacterium]